MNKKKNKHEKRFRFQQQMIEDLRSEIKMLKNELNEKDEIINSVAPLRNELTENVNAIRKYKEEYRTLIQELKKMKSIANKEIYKGRWWLIRLLLK